VRYFIKIAYDGTKYHGWQKQKNAHSVQQEIEKCLSIVLREKIEITGAGRTDTGVHALGQYAHFDTSYPIPPDFFYKINGILPNSISILNVFEAPQNFHARFDAVFRKYIYRISRKKNPFELERSLFLPIPLDLELMQNAANQLLKFKNFSSFCKSHANNLTYFCDVHYAEWKTLDEEHILEFHIQANRFLRGMVRAIVGTLIDVGKKKITVEDFINIILSENRQNAKMNVAPFGLYLVEVGYPPNSLKKLDL
jgi:tRNA pseudouridine38-40 synthase